MSRKNAVVYWYDGTTYGGIETSLITFFSLYDRARLQPRFVWANQTKTPRLARQLEETGTEQFDLTPPIGAPGDQLRRAASTLSLLRRLRPDIIHITSCGSLTQGALVAIARSLDIPVIRTAHLPFSRWQWNVHAIRSKWRRKVHQWLTSMVARTVSVSDIDRMELIETGLFEASKCVTIFNGTDVARFRNPLPAAEAKQRLGLAPDQPTIGLLGRLHPQKQFHQPIAAMRGVLKEHPRAKLLIIGEGPDEAALREQARSLGVEGAVGFFGYRDDIPQCLPAFDVFAIPSMFESQPLVMHEGLAAGRAIVATPLECFVEMIGSSGAAQLTDGSDPEALARAYCDLLGNPAARATMGAAALELVESFTGDLNTRRVLDLYDTVLAERGA